MAGLFPPIEPYEHGMLDVGHGHRIYWECSGNPDGEPALVLHGGPGSGASVNARRNFDPQHYRIIVFDQRNCGRSTPHAAEPDVDLSHNTTSHLVADIEALRVHVGVEQWLILGGSWGVTLALAYAEAHPHRVSALVLYSVATTTRAEIEWITRGVGRFFPEQFATFLDGLPKEERSGNLAKVYHRLLMHPAPDVHDGAARNWCAWEDAILATIPGYTSHPRWSDPRFRLCFARIVTHYWGNAAWLDEGALKRDIGKLAGIRAILIHGRMDLGSPLQTAWDLHQAWPGSELVVVGTAGHDSRDPGMAETIVAATERFRRKAC